METTADEVQKKLSYYRIFFFILRFLKKKVKKTPDAQLCPVHTATCGYEILAAMRFFNRTMRAVVKCPGSQQIERSKQTELSGAFLCVATSSSSSN